MSSADAAPPANRDRTPNSVVLSEPQAVPGDDASIRLDDFQVLLGTDGRTARSSPTRRIWYRWVPQWMKSDYREPQDAMAIYPKILREEKSTLRRLYTFEILVYTCLALQLVISSTLVIISAISGDHHIVVAVLGAITALITGVLSLIKGQGQPTRLINYAHSLQKVRDDIEFCESGLKAGVREVTYKQIIAFWNEYTSVRDSNTANRPDVWAPQERNTRAT
ncbi:hypothetical protein IFM58399_06873 [Aspergillus lentulus]|uniref:SMODS and SLOG-associating 2TM effector domain-containing protein n=1 Tax=Aspergillus lentulus TaxID=293939 RepID=A0AAN6BNH8_ASPLE|nr:uncharacterized protein IFM58399_06873 [Aspergillus lentulus]KAF4180777.1 hypothetical protein CNMCM8060_000879 [Aspergillus lentulus]KAF4194269.1 hypothetical protein CNMCM8694_007760 [Aspergillus lentulus]KAF4204004.1 hypothetical protein CNMCM8927_008045 [Aspergillus lentulus]GFF43227.1 hypothetical protein IFM58399_06873 [Aspergillus lentulus]GFG03077.1 hypothetical protein IFM61392_02620 [Aspergillus lentulus]